MTPCGVVPSLVSFRPDELIPPGQTPRSCRIACSHFVASDAARTPICDLSQATAREPALRVFLAEDFRRATSIGGYAMDRVVARAGPHMLGMHRSETVHQDLKTIAQEPRLQEKTVMRRLTFGRC